MTLRDLLCWFGRHGETVRETDRDDRNRVLAHRVRCLWCGWTSPGWWVG